MRSRGYGSCTWTAQLVGVVKSLKPVTVNRVVGRLKVKNPLTVATTVKLSVELVVEPN